MRRGRVLGRRRLLGLGLLATLGGGFLLGGRGRPGIRWGRVRAWPGACVPLFLHLPRDLERGASLWLELDHPGGRERYRLLVGESLAFRDRTEISLVYPHQGRVPGTYVYRAVVEWNDGRRWETPTTVAYRVGRAAWLS